MKIKLEPGKYEIQETAESINIILRARKLFISGTLKTTTIDECSGIKRVSGQIKGDTMTQSLIFPKDKGFDLLFES